MTLPAILVALFEKIAANPVISAIAGVLVVLIGTYIKAYISKLGGIHAERKFGSNEDEMPAGKPEIFTDPTTALMPKRYSAGVRGLASPELIDFYRNQRPYSITIDGTRWGFAASRAIAPVGTGKVSEQAIRFDARLERFTLDAALDLATRKLLDQLELFGPVDSLFNGDPFRISALDETEDETVIRVGRCKYFDSLRTNFSMDMPLDGREMTLRELLHGETRAFEPFSDSRLPNHMGVVIIVETCDGHIVFQRRSQNVSVRPNTLSASVSGTFEKDDFLCRDGKHLIPLADALQGPCREMHGELGGNYGISIDDLYFLGLMREFRRGGFPDFYFYYSSPLAFEQIRENARHAEEKKEVLALESGLFSSAAFLSRPDEEGEPFARRVDAMLHDLDRRDTNLTLSLGVALTYDLMLRRARLGS